MDKMSIDILLNPSDLRSHIEALTYDAKVSNLTKNGMPLGEAMLEASLSIVNGFQGELIEFGEQAEVDL